MLGRMREEPTEACPVDRLVFFAFSKQESAFDIRMQHLIFKMYVSQDYTLFACIHAMLMCISFGTLQAKDQIAPGISRDELRRGCWCHFTTQVRPGRVRTHTCVLAF